MERVTGLGGVFIKSPDPDRLKSWYSDHLGLAIEDWGGVSLPCRESSERTIWSVFPDDSTYFDPSPAPFMVNFRVADLHALLAVLRDEGCDVEDRVEESEFGRFGWVMDPDGNRVELWEPPA